MSPLAQTVNILHLAAPVLCHTLDFKLTPAEMIQAVSSNQIATYFTQLFKARYRGSSAEVSVNLHYVKTGSRHIKQI